LDADAASHLKKNADNIARFLIGGGHPLLVTFDRVDTDDLLAERSRMESVKNVILRLPEPDDPFSTC